MKRVNWKILSLCFLLVFFVAFFGSFFVSQSVNSSWYLEGKPSFTPPNYVFGPVWTVLYILIAFSIYLSWNSSNKKQKKKLTWLFGINLLANGLWSWLFFSMQNPVLAFIDILIILFSIVALMLFTSKINKASMWLLVPYLIWVCFATILNLNFII